MNEILVYYKAVDFCLEPLSSAGRKSQIEPSGIVKLSSQSSGFEAHEEIGICGVKGELWKRKPCGEERSQICTGSHNCLAKY